MKSSAMNALLPGSNNFNCINVGLNNGQYVPVWGPEARQDSLRSLGNRLENDTPRQRAKKKRVQRLLGQHQYPTSQSGAFSSVARRALEAVAGRVSIPESW